LTKFLYVQSYKELKLKAEYGPTLLSATLRIIDSFRRNNNTFVFSARYVVQRALEMLPRIFETRRILIGLQIRVDEFDEAIEVFSCDLHIVSIESV
jgi:hypothetical protein